MSKKELIEAILDIIHSANSGLSTHQRLSEIEKVLNQNKEDDTLSKETMSAEKAKELKQLVGLAMSIEECQCFIDGVIEEANQPKELEND